MYYEEVERDKDEKIKKIEAIKRLITCFSTAKFLFTSLSYAFLAGQKTQRRL